MMKTADISVAISTLNRRDALARCLDALWSGEMLPSEVIIVDQSRDDITRSIVEDYQSQQLSIIYVRQELLGLAASQNAAFTNASCPVVAVIDDDCVPDREWLAKINQAFATHDALDGLTGRVLPLGPDGDKLYPVSCRTSAVRTEFSGKYKPWSVGSGNNFAVKRELFKRIGGCDERLGPGSPGMGGVDMDLFYRLLRAGAHIRYEPEALVYHERQNRAGRIARRPMYGHGMGACCTIWLRQGDLYALRILGSWMIFHCWLMVGGIWQRHWTSVYEEVLMLGGTVRGLFYGLHVRENNNVA
jgi:O-antigen biosynthesis protein